MCVAPHIVVPGSKSACKRRCFFWDIAVVWDRDSVVGIATRYGLDGRGSNPGGGEIFYTRLDRPWGPSSLLYNGYRISFAGVKRPGRGVDHPPLSSAEVKERIELYLYSTSRVSWRVLG